MKSLIMVLLFLGVSSCGKMDVTVSSDIPVEGNAPVVEHATSDAELISLQEQLEAARIRLEEATSELEEERAAREVASLTLEIAQANTIVLQSSIDSLIDELYLMRLEAENGVTVVELCLPGGEILLRLPDDRLTAFFQDGATDYLALIQPGMYITGDDEQCHFYIDDNFDIFYIDPAGIITDEFGNLVDPLDNPIPGV